MKREIVLSTSGGMVLTGSGLRPVAGNSEFGTGAKVFILDNAILGQKRTQARRKPFAIETVTTQPPLPVVGYKFASGTTMYYTDLDLNLLREEQIPVPVDGAQLLAHTYNERAEYLIWFVDARCIIQRDGETIADFISEFYYAPDEIDAYVDDNDDLIWGAAGEGAGIVTMAVYKNGSVTKTASYSEEQVESNFAERQTARMQARPFTATIAPSTTEVTTEPAFTFTGLSGVVYDVQHDSFRLYSNPLWSTGSIGSTILFDLFSADAFACVSAEATGYIYQRVSGTERNSSGVDVATSRETVQAVGQLRATTVFRSSTGEIISEWQQLDSGAWVDHYATYHDRVLVDFADNPTDINMFTVTFNWQNTASVFKVQAPSLGATYKYIEHGFMNVPFSVRGGDGANKDAERTGVVTGFGVAAGTPILTLTFSQPWDYLPADGDVFIAEFRLGTLTVERGYADIDAAITPDNYQNDSGKTIITNRGNGYSTIKDPKIENVFGWVSFSGAMFYNGQKIHDAQYYSLLDGAWMTEDGKAVGVAGYEIIKAEGATVTLIEPQFNPSVATKRFTEVTI